MRIMLAFYCCLFLSACGTTISGDFVSVTTSSGTHTFTVELADTPAERQVGLMERIDLASNEGMLFIFPSLSLGPFWMKNTPLSLDIIFISEGEQVLQIAENTTPNSEDLILPTQAYRYVLEVLAGTSSSIGLQVGDSLSLPN